VKHFRSQCSATLAAGREPTGDERTESPDGSRRAANVGSNAPDGSRRAANVGSNAPDGSRRTASVCFVALFRKLIHSVARRCAGMLRPGVSARSLRDR
jgi:hypothetical protein